MLYKHRLKTSSKKYFLRYAMYAAVTFLLWWGEDAVCNRIAGSLWRVCGLRLAICMTITNLAYLLCYCRRKEFKLIVTKAGEILRHR